MMIGRLTLLAVGLMTLLSSSNLICAANEFSSFPEKSELKLTTENIVIFKDGYFLIVKKGKAKTDADGKVFTNEVPDSAILGSFWAIAQQGKINSMVAGWEASETEDKREKNCTTVMEIVTANLGRSCSLRIRSEKPEVVNGVLLKVLANRELIPEKSLRHARSQHDSGSGSIETEVLVDTIAGTHFLLRTETGDMMIAADSVSNLTVEGMKTTVEQKVKKLTREKKLTFDFGTPNTEVELSLMYFCPGIRWIPTYRLNLTDKPFVFNWAQGVGTERASAKTAEILMQGEIINDSEDLIDVPLHVVVGVPNFRFKSSPSPMVLEASLKNVLAEAAPQVMRNQSIDQFSNTIYSQSTSDFRSARATGNSEGIVDGLSSDLTASGGNDLFVYKLKPMSLKKGERASVRILKAEVAYRDIYTWDVTVQHSPHEFVSSRDGGSPLVISESEVWHQIELINDTNVPWTTGAAMLVDGFQPLAQELLTYTSPGGICRLPMTVSVDLKATVDDQETGRERDAVKWRNSSYSLIKGKIAAELANNKEIEVPVEVSLRFGGKANAVSDEGKPKLEGFNPNDWSSHGGDPINNSSVVKWKTSIAPGECFKPTVEYEFYLRN
ncbi:MAG: hypothetical protein ACKVHR_05730 [Pirellulales bacterium]